MVNPANVARNASSSGHTSIQRMQSIQSCVTKFVFSLSSAISLISIGQTLEQFPHWVHLWPSFFKERSPIFPNKDSRALMGQYEHRKRLFKKDAVKRSARMIIEREERTILVPLEKSMRIWLKLPSNMGSKDLAGHI